MTAQKRLNLTKTVRKLPISENLERKGYYMHDDKHPDVKYDSEEHQVAFLRAEIRSCTVPGFKMSVKKAVICLGGVMHNKQLLTSAASHVKCACTSAPAESSRCASRQNPLFLSTAGGKRHDGRHQLVDAAHAR